MPDMHTVPAHPRESRCLPLVQTYLHIIYGLSRLASPHVAMGHNELFDRGVSKFVYFFLRIVLVRDCHDYDCPL